MLFVLLVSAGAKHVLLLLQAGGTSNPSYGGRIVLLFPHACSPYFAHTAIPFSVQRLSSGSV